MSELQEKTYAKSLAKGLLAGMIGGLVATAAKSIAERIYPPRTHGEAEPPGVLAEKVAGHPLAAGEMTVAQEAMSTVSVLVMDWTTTGAPPPTWILPTFTPTVL